MGIAIFSFIFFAFTLGALDMAGAEETRGVSATEIHIGYIPDLTGPAAHASRSHLWGIRRYFDMVNNEGGIHGRKIKLFIEDEKYNPSIALNAFKKLVLKKKVFAMVGNMGSAPFKAELPLFEKYKVPLISPAVLIFQDRFPN